MMSDTDAAPIEETVTTPAPDADASPAADTPAVDAAAPDADGGAKPDADATPDAGDNEPEPFSVAAPEGFEDHADAFKAYGDSMGEWLKANPDATPAQALQQAAAWQAEQVTAAAKAQEDAFAAQVDGWSDAARADAEIGGDKFDENLAAATKALDAFGTQELKQALTDTGLGSHPEMIRLLVKAGKAVQESTVETGGIVTPRKSLVSSLYGGAAS